MQNLNIGDTVHLSARVVDTQEQIIVSIRGRQIVVEPDSIVKHIVEPVPTTAEAFRRLPQAHQDDVFRRLYAKWISNTPTPVKPRTVEDWMRENDREPWGTGNSWYWDSPDSPAISSREAIPGGVFARLRPGSSQTRGYLSRDDAVADLRKVLLSLELIAE